jgi:hypothetical protein
VALQARGAGATDYIAAEINYAATGIDADIYLLLSNHDGRKWIRLLIESQR